VESDVVETEKVANGIGRLDSAGLPITGSGPRDTLTADCDEGAFNVLLSA
jgi:hypothetical protein